jgi:hypothetical protein
MFRLSIFSDALVQKINGYRGSAWLTRLTSRLPAARLRASKYPPFSEGEILQGFTTRPLYFVPV